MRKGNGGGKGGEEERWGAAGRDIMRYIEETSRDSKTSFGDKFIGVAFSTALQRRESNRCP